MSTFDRCTHSNSKPLIVVKEKQRVACFRNEQREAYRLTRFDGCVECAGRKADFVLTHADQRQVLIELKGRHVEEAREQLVNTFDHMRSVGCASGRPAALIVCSKVPLGVSAVQRLTADLKSAGLGKVKVKSGEWKGRFADLF